MGDGSCDEIWGRFKRMIEDGVERFIPKKVRIKGKQKPPW